PVLIDFPKDVQMAFVDVDEVALSAVSPPHVQPRITPAAELAIDQAAALLASAERPVLVAGHGVVMAGAAPELLRFAEASGIPVGTTLLGLGAFPDQHPQALGMVGMHGTVQANLAMHHADLVIGVGMRFDDRVVGRPIDFAPGARIVHVDVDPGAFDRVVRADVPVLADAGLALRALTGLCDRRDRSAWWTRLRQWTGDHERCGILDADRAPLDGSPTTPEVVRALRRVTGGAATLVSDIGQHQMFMALHHGFDRPGQMLTSGGLGTMGYALPAALGAKAAEPGRPVWAIVGDGGFQMSSPELSTLVASNLPVKVLIVNNRCLGMVRQWQELFYDNVYSQSILPQPSFEALARAHGCWATTVLRRDELEPALRDAALHPGPAVVDVHVPMEETVYPMVPAGCVPGDVRCMDPVDASVC
ncbi:MAG: thiamine pyrophosphate-dependent enzyme, partial [Chloroflexota bacterium]|nr:thiamine pyrophosphate-dependent enzyme [Chloroflexota bacterium]